MSEVLEFEIIGLTKEKAQEIISNKNYISRIASIDGENFILTMDYRLDRINLHVKNNKIINYYIG